MVEREKPDTRSSLQIDIVWDHHLLPLHALYTYVSPLMTWTGSQVGREATGLIKRPCVALV